MDGYTVVVLGAGGHAKVAIRTLELSGYQIVGVFDDNPGKHGESIMGYPIQGYLEDVLGSGCNRALLAIGDNATRQQLVARFPNLEWITAIHPHAWVDTSVVLGPGTVVFAGAVIQADTVIGKHTIINTGASIDHDCVLGDFTHIAPGAHLAGQIIVGEGCLVGIGAVVIPGKHIGEWATLGAGSVTVKDIPAHVVATGVPACPK